MSTLIDGILAISFVCFFSYTLLSMFKRKNGAREILQSEHRQLLDEYRSKTPILSEIEDVTYNRFLRKRGYKLIEDESLRSRAEEDRKAYIRGTVSGTLFVGFSTTIIILRILGLIE